MGKGSKLSVFGYRRNGIHSELVSIFCIWLEFTVEGAAAVASDKSSVLIFNRVVASNFRIYDLP